MDEKDGPPPEEPVHTPVSATVPITNTSTNGLLLDAQSDKNRDRVVTGNNQETKCTNNHQKSKPVTALVSNETFVARQSESPETRLSGSLDSVVIEYGGTSGSDLDSTSDLEFSSDDEDCEHETTEDFLPKATNYCDPLNKNGIDTCDLGAGDMNTPDADEYVHTKVASLPLKPTEATVIFENEYFQVKRSDLAGWGAFAVRELKEGDQILLEKPLFTATNLTLFDGFASLSKPLQDVAYSLHANDNFHAAYPVEVLIWKTNAFSTANPSKGRCYDEAGLFPIASRFNHACEPMNSVKWHYSHADGNLKMTIQAKSIEAGKELTITYDTLSPIALYDRYGFQCSCGGCPGLSDWELKEREECQW
ncbi:hypothetical protein NXS19_001737 [Fusarium pseudograminearum]|uniref:SET domain-containing protein n=1 Tax=Fusarium pseudograminearum (strain CS3096) TaxID=1028729 RepID=K3VF24_FUSPC|nr:hypothetical protein FPSE_08557 [Fusarium pseudograminearum CS3096]EKJ71318.1 hypothetical protein FPSE_08557 [Fusarium pseudograminearum CS3096]KAF0637408.1 hypothetical protein FPSE5266_08557 [Fusarium pseudograminearum]UZP33921.1 hypothetical protein NXS19_001737 [Fusarium pseudograminearum]